MEVGSLTIYKILGEGLVPSEATRPGAKRTRPPIGLKSLPMGRSGQVLGEGLEPSRLTAPEPKSGVSANFTTRADGPST